MTSDKLQGLRDTIRSFRRSLRHQAALREQRRITASQGPRVRLFHWQPKSGRVNFGDHLSHVVVTKLLADRGHVLEEGVTKPKRLLAIGSILHFAHDEDVVWGSGVNGKVAQEEHRFKNLDVRAVRGPLTKSFLEGRGVAVPAIFGDPALLLPHLFPGRFRRTSRRRRVIVPNLHDIQALSSNREDIVSPLLPWNQCVEKILEADLVISSSLHGLIIAEAYGVPSRLLRVTETENLFKYEDYIRGTGRTELIYARSIDEAMRMEGMPAPQWCSAPLLKAFPVDLWGPSFPLP